MNLRLFSASACVLAAVALFACKHDDDDHDHDHGSYDKNAVTLPSCKAIVDVCHEVDVGEGPIHDCHDLSHEATSDAPCAARKDECLKICAPASDAGAADAKSGG